MSFVQLFFIYLAFTIVVEMTVLYLSIRYIYKITNDKISTKIIIACGFISVITLPFVWFVFPNIINNYIIYVAIAETFAVVAEMIFYFYILKISWSKAFLVSFLCNLTSFLFGLFVLNNLFTYFGG